MGQFLVAFVLIGDRSSERHDRIAKALEALGAEGVRFGRWRLTAVDEIAVRSLIRDLFNPNEKVTVVPFTENAERDPTW